MTESKKTETETESRPYWDAEIKLIVAGRTRPVYSKLPGGLTTELKTTECASEIHALRWTVAMLRGLLDASEAQMMRLIADEPDPDSKALSKKALRDYIDMNEPDIGDFSR